MMNLYYILDEHNNPVEVELFEYAKFMSSNQDKRIVKQEMIHGLKVSTVFLGLDHRFTDDGPPILFETMIFGVDHGGYHDDYQERYCTWAEAEEGHKRAVALVNSSTEKQG